MVRNFKSLFFENIGIKQTILKNTFWLTVAEIVSHFLNLALIIYIARILGAADFGKFAFALSFVSMLVIFSNLGLANLAIRELSREEEKEKEYPAVLSLKIILSIGALILMLAGSFLITADFVIRKAIWVLSVFILISGFLNVIYAFLHARQKMEYEAGGKIIQSLLITGLGFLILFAIPSVKNLTYGYLFANLITLVIVLLFFHFTFQSLKLNFNRNIWKKFLKLSWPLTLGFIGLGIYINIDSVMIGYFDRAAQIGWYNAAGKIALTIIVSVVLISKSFYPVLSKFFKESKEKLQEIWDYQMQSMIILSLPIMTGGIVLAPKIINFFYASKNYSPSIFVFQILIFVAGIYFFCYPCNMILIVSDQQKKNFWLISTGVLMNILLNLILIPRYSLYGAAIATMITSIIILLSVILLSKYFTPISPFSLKLFRIFIAAVFSSLIMFMILKQPIIYNLNFLVSVLIGGTVYFLFFFGFKRFIDRFSLVKIK